MDYTSNFKMDPENIEKISKKKEFPSAKTTGFFSQNQVVAVGFLEVSIISSPFPKRGYLSVVGQGIGQGPYSTTDALLRRRILSLQ